MIIGKNRPAVIENIKAAAESEDFYAKVEIDDPVLTADESRQIVDNYLKRRKKLSYKVKSCAACAIADMGMMLLNKDTEIIGAQKLEKINGGAIITSNHFSPTENTIVRLVAKKCLKKRLKIVSQVTNFAMSGFVGFLMNYANTVPLLTEPRYITRDFMKILQQALNKNEIILVYPEQEMWFNYRKPRPPKRGAYLFAAKLNTPVISCFVEMIDTKIPDTKEINKVKYKIHILDVLYPDPQLSSKENSQMLCEKDTRLKTLAYEKIYGKKLEYSFSPDDIAGLR